LSCKNYKSPDYSVSSNRPPVHNYDGFINHDNEGAASSEKSILPPSYNMSVCRLNGVNLHLSIASTIDGQ